VTSAEAFSAALGLGWRAVRSRAFDTDFSTSRATWSGKQERRESLGR
jgi:hypothetical protein